MLRVRYLALYLGYRSHFASLAFPPGRTPLPTSVLTLHLNTGLARNSYQYRFGGTLTSSIHKLYADGGLGRYYAGLGPALFQGPIGACRALRSEPCLSKRRADYSLLFFLLFFSSIPAARAPSPSRFHRAHRMILSFGLTIRFTLRYLTCPRGSLRYILAPSIAAQITARFGDTAANAGILALLSSNPFLAKLPSPVKTVFSSTAGALFRMVLVPVDTLKVRSNPCGCSRAGFGRSSIRLTRHSPAQTTMQTQGGASGVTILKERIKAYGIGTLWYGAFATAAASFVGSFPW